MTNDKLDAAAENLNVLRRTTKVPPELTDGEWRLIMNDIGRVLDALRPDLADA